MEEIKISKELQEIINKTEKENAINDIIHSNNALVNALSAIHYFNNFENNLNEAGIDIVDGTDFRIGMSWLLELIKLELMYEFDDIPEEYFKTDDYFDTIYGLHLTDGALIVELSMYINWVRENIK